MLSVLLRSSLAICILASALSGCSKGIVQSTNVITGSEAGDNKYPYPGGMPKDVNKGGSGGGSQGKGPPGPGGPGGPTGPGGPGKK